MFKNLKVIELATVLAGPSVGMFFAELGAEVIKIEPPSGDVTRSWKSKSETDPNKISAYYTSINWGKQVVTLNLKLSSDLDQLYALVKEADIVIQSYKGSDDKKLKVDYETLCKINPTIIVGKISGYSQNANRVGYDAIIQAESGFMSMNGEPGTPPTKMPIAMIDILAGHQLKEGLLCALINRYQTGKGSIVKVSLYDSAISALANQASNYLNSNTIPQQLGSDHPNIVPYGTVFFCKDQIAILLAIGTDDQFLKFSQYLNLEHVSKDPRYATNASRVIHKKDLLEILSDSISQKLSSDLIDFCLNNNIPVGAVKNMSQVFENMEAKELLLTSSNYKTVRTAVFQSDFKKDKHLREPQNI